MATIATVNESEWWCMKSFPSFTKELPLGNPLRKTRQFSAIINFFRNQEGAFD
jgi:hypothetical protein